MLKVPKGAMQKYKVWMEFNSIICNRLTTQNWLSPWKLWICIINW